jgi:phosphatidylserine decarboxylase
VKQFPIAKEGLAFVLPALFLVVVFYYLSLWYLVVPFLFLTLFFLYFFRNPVRNGQSEQSELISPADGRVMRIEELIENEFLKEKVKRIAIFMSVFDVHVNRAPCEADIERVQHRDGKFKMAFKKGIDDENERNYIVLRQDSERLLVVQIAGFLARRIICYVREHQKVSKGSPVGMIAFGSRVDVYMPTDYEVTVKPGQKVKSGLTVLARKKGEQE